MLPATGSNLHRGSVFLVRCNRATVQGYNPIFLKGCAVFESNVPDNRKLKKKACNFCPLDIVAIWGTRQHQQQKLQAFNFTQ
jgi:hypothetical protein